MLGVVVEWVVQKVGGEKNQGCRGLGAGGVP